MAEDNEDKALSKIESLFHKVLDERDAKYKAEAEAEAAKLAEEEAKRPRQRPRQRGIFDYLSDMLGSGQ